MATFKDQLKAWFFSNNSSAADQTRRIPLLDSSGNAVGSDTLTNVMSAMFASDPRVIPNNTNLDDVYQRGLWCTRTKATASTLQNLPFTADTGFTMLVLNAQGNQLKFTQQIIFYMNRVYIRFQNGTKWGSWSLLSMTTVS